MGENSTWRDGRRVGRTVGATLGGALGATVGREGAAVHDGDLEMEGSDVGRGVYDGLCTHTQRQGQHRQRGKGVRVRTKGGVGRS